jgi:acetyl esterase/lipase
MRSSRFPGLALLALIAPQVSLTPLLAAAEDPEPRPYVDANGVAHLPAMDVPPSRFMSPEARRRFVEMSWHPQPASGTPAPPAESGPTDYRRLRQIDEDKNAHYVARSEVLYPVTMEPKVIGGVRTLVVTPKAGVAPRNRSRVLINLHGGAFLWGEGNGAKAESIPIAGLGRITVITVAYRMAPEFRFPAASEDVAAVYRELLKTHRAVDIGVYGCSAGGILAAESVAWFQKENLPMPGAIGTFCGSAEASGGDSAYVTFPLVGAAGPGDDSGSFDSMEYFRGTSSSDPMVVPIKSQEVLRRFPPTLLIAGSRDFMVSALFHAQVALSDAGVDAELHVWDGMWHAFIFDPDLPESQQVYRVVVGFFDRHLGRSPASGASRG